MKTTLLSMLAAVAALANSLAQPEITLQPADVLAILGQEVRLRTSATGTGALSFEWYKEGALLPNQTSRTLSLTRIQTLDAGNYFAVVRDDTGSATSRVARVEVIGPVALDPRVGPNIRLGEDPPTLPTDLRSQAEPHIARSPLDPNLLVAAFQEGRHTDGAAVSCGYAISANGGLSWSRSLIPKITRLTGGNAARAGDSVVAFDLLGNLYLNHVLIPGAPPPHTTVISRSSDLGLSFSDPIPAYHHSSLEVDKPWLAINAFPNAATENRLAVAFNIFEDGRDQLHFTFSDDQGATWSPKSMIGPVRGTYPQTLFLPDGSLVVAYFRYLDSIPNGFSATSRGQIEIIRSPDGGNTWTETNVLAVLTGSLHHDSIARDGWDLVSLCADRHAGILYAAYQALHGPQGNRVPRILFTRSLDKGKTWSQPLPVNDTPSGQSVFNPCIAASADGQHVVIAFYDKRHQTPNSNNNFVDYYLAESHDGGDIWETNLRLSDVSSDLRLVPLTGAGRMLADYQGLVGADSLDVPAVAVWIDTRNGDGDPYAVRIDRRDPPNFNVWKRLRFTGADLEHQNVSDLFADPDNDGIVNWFEFLFNRDPKTADTRPLIDSARIGSRGDMIVSYQTLADAPDVRWLVSENLQNWDNASPSEISVSRHSDPSLSRRAVSFETTSKVQFFRPGLPIRF